ncbi:ImuA family protein [Acuticoccus mangrovi]|uniref:Protein ImuA n=1 Tax=Acuticoccus mangrovi TaxID=2796142 RepID=A0A934ISI6_9HYPH|nr:hypothetical protein [Acuticoccus mangrovi]MBJ3777920.1 hypothetical protein [Acuticoccus mangrovi]
MDGTLTNPPIVSPSAEALRSLIDRACDVHFVPNQRSKQELFFSSSTLRQFFSHQIRASLHIFHMNNILISGILSGFILNLVHSRNLKYKLCTYVTHEYLEGESGRLDGAGLEGLGFEPSEWLVVFAKNSSYVLFAIEEALHSGVVDAVVAELPVTTAVEFKTTQRLALKSTRAGVPVFLILSGPSLPLPTAARTRWEVSAVPSRCGDQDRWLGDPAWRVRLLKNRDGPCGEAIVRFSPREQRIYEVPTQERSGRLSANFPRLAP